MDFAIGLVNFVLNLPGGQVKFLEKFKLQKNCEINSAHQNIFGLVGMMFRLVNVSFSLLKWRALKMTFFAPCSQTKLCSEGVIEVICVLHTAVTRR